MPPVRFQALVDAVAPDEIKPAIAVLSTLKRETPEIGIGDAVPEINAFVRSEIERHDGTLSGQGRPDLLDKGEVRDELNGIFRETIAAAF